MASPDASLARRYEDYVLGKFAADMSLERASDELQKYRDRDRDRALAYAVQQMQQRAGLRSAHIGPAAIKALLAMTPAVLQQEFYAALSQGFSETTLSHWEEVIQAVRNIGEMLGAEDIFELASGTALSKFGQRLALRQVMQVSQQFMAGLPKQKPTGARRHYSVATHILEEDLYPVGGFSSIANRGTMESLLRSELAYMETDDRPDLFDIKYARDELLYYSRDENQFFRRRVTVMFVFDRSLVAARVKDAHLPWQRIVMTMGLVVATVKTLTEWLSSDALKFELLFPTHDAVCSLPQERELLELIFQEEIRADRLCVTTLDENQLRLRTQENARLSLCHRVLVHARSSTSVRDWLQPAAQTIEKSVWQPLSIDLCVAEAWPAVAYDEQTWTFAEADNPWRESLQAMLTGLVA